MRKLLPRLFGEFIANLVLWDWFINPITFRDAAFISEPPAKDAAMAQVWEFFGLVQKQAYRPIGWMMAEEFGSLGGRFHCHGLVTGVAELRRDFWWREAHRRFGRTRIEPFDANRAGAWYAAKYAAKKLGVLHFGGTLVGVDLERLIGPANECGMSGTSVLSAELPRDYYHLGMGRWHR